MENVAVPVSSVQVSSDRKKVSLSLPGLKTGRVVHIAANGLLAQDGKPLWYKQTYYTLNAMSESAPFQPVPVRIPEVGSDGAQPFKAWRSPLGDLHLELPSAGPVRVRVLDPAGHVVAMAEASGSELFPRSLFRSGVYLVQVVSGRESHVKKVVMK